MKNVIYWVFLLPFLVVAQNEQSEGEMKAQEKMVVENILLTPHPEKIKEFEAGVTAHNKKYHSKGYYGVRMYYISSGPDSGKYIWSMGPLPWSALDKRPDDAEGHTADWNNNVAPYILPDTDLNYWQFHPELSNFSNEFEIKNLLVDMYDVKRFEGERTMKNMEKVMEVMTKKHPEITYGVYTNTLPSTKDGRDLAMVFFFDELAWMGEDSKFVKSYEEINGEGSFKSFMKEWGEVTDGKQSELWSYVEKLSGLGPQTQTSTQK